MAGFAFHPDFLSVRFYDSFGDGESHSGSLSVKTVAAAAVELIENAGTLVLFDAGPLVGDSNDDFFAFAMRGTSTMSIPVPTMAMVWGLGARVWGGRGS